jgi:hypothetical protein
LELLRNVRRLRKEKNKDPMSKRSDLKRGFAIKE